MFTTTGLLKALGTLLTIAAIVFVIAAFVRSGVARLDLWGLPRTWLVVGGVGLLYGATLGLVLKGWFLLLEGSSSGGVDRPAAVRSYAAFQVLKYLPTNLFHHAGRYAMLRQSGVDHTAIIWSSVAEATLIAAGAIIVAFVFGLQLLKSGLTTLSPWPIASIVVALVVLAGGTLVALRRSAAARQSLARLVSPRSLRAIVLATTLYVGFFVAMGCGFWLMAQWLPGEMSRPALAPSIAAISAAWLLGFLTPGAPAGLGIREAMIILALGGEHAAEAVVLSTLFRVVTIVGDMVFATACYLTARRSTSDDGR